MNFLILGFHFTEVYSAQLKVSRDAVVSKKARGSSSTAGDDMEDNEDNDGPKIIGIIPHILNCRDSFRAKFSYYCRS